MIQYNSKDAYLEIPKGLGNLGGNSGGGTDVTALSGSVVELQATVESEAARLNGLSATTENIASQADYAISGVNALSGSVETLTSEVDSQGDAIADLLLDVDGLDTRVSGNTSDIEALSAQTSANTASITALSSATENVSQTVESVSAQTSANTAQIEALSAVTSGLASTVSEMAGKQASIYDWDAFWASDDYSERMAIYSAFTQDFAQGKMVLMKGTTSDGSLIYLRLEKVSTSSPYLASFRYESDGGYTNIYITSSGNESGDRNNQGKLTRNKLAAASASTLASSAYTRADSAYTLASSAYTLADSLTGQTGGPQVIFLNKLTEQERIALYNELAAQYDYNAQSWTSAFTEDKYAFYIDLRDYADQQDYQLNDSYEGFFPMKVVRMHPSDYGGGAFFSGVEADRYGNGELVNIRFVIAYDGQVDKGTWWNRAVEVGTECMYVDPQGNMGHRGADFLFDEGSVFKIVVKGCELDFSAEYGFGWPVYSRRSDTGNGWKYWWSLIVPTDTGVMKGVWHCDTSQGGDLGDMSTYVLDSWTAL